jgi:hypothetical protein
MVKLVPVKCPFILTFPEIVPPVLSYLFDS